jgi:hypothetical protein
MELSDLIPDNSSNWSVKNDFLMFKKIQNIPTCFISNDNIVYVFLDVRIYKQVLKLTSLLVDKGVEFYFTIPEISNPKGIEDLNDTTVLHYLHSYSKKEFFNGFRKIDFDLIYNLIKWTEKENCFDLVKDNYEYMLKKVNHQDYDYYSNRSTYKYSEEIREEFRSLYRDIQISKIL